jgi:hypothetical protein
LRAVNWCFEPADQISACPQLLRTATTVNRILMIGATMEEVEDEPLFAERVAGIDIGKKEVMVTIRVPSDTRHGRRQQETREFRTVRKDLLALADWLRAWGVTKIGMEATLDYWKPVYFLLEREGFDCVLYHAAQVKALPGRPKKTSWTRCGWRRSPSGARCRAASCRRRKSAGCAPIPATGGTWSRPAPPRRHGARNCSKTPI